MRRILNVGPALCALAVLQLAGGCGDAPPARASRPAGRIVIRTSFYPAAFLARSIGGDRVDVTCALPAGADPAAWQPDEQAVARFQAADLIVINGANFEPWLDKVSLPPSRVVDLSFPLRDRLLHYPSAGTHSHGTAGEHTHEGIDGHTWMDPLHAKTQAEQILKALKRIDPPHAGEYQSNLAKLASALDGLDARFQEVTRALAGRPIVTSHPAYNYLAQRYGWKLHNLELDPDEDISAAGGPIGAVMAPYDELPAKRPLVMLWESAPAERLAQGIKRRFGLICVVFAPCENPSPERLRTSGYLGLMRANLDRLAAAPGLGKE